jgi:uncharacterized membrane-anchored protein
MKTKNTLIIVFIIVSIIQLAIPANMIYKHEKILTRGKTFKFRIAAYDPADPFRGNFIAINIAENHFKADSLADWKQGEDIYVWIKVNEKDGYVRIVDVLRNKPSSNTDFVKAKIGYVTETRLVIEYPFEKYYLEEFKAPEAETTYFESARDTTKNNYVVVNVIDGAAVLRDLIINDKSIKNLK